MSGATVFISHAKEDRERAQRLASALLLNGVPVWYDEWEVLVGHGIYDTVYRGILEARYLAVLLTRASLSSRWVAEELGLARQRELEGAGVVILPLVFDQVEVPLHLRTRRYADFTRFEAGLEELLRAMGSVGPVVAIDDRVLREIRAAVSTRGSTGPALLSTVVKTFSGAELVRSSALAPRDAGSAVLAEQRGIRQLGRVHIDFSSLGRRVPMIVDMKAPVRLAVAAIVRAFDLPESFGGARASYFLLHEGAPLELGDTLWDQGVADGATLQIGCYAFVLE